MKSVAAWTVHKEQIYFIGNYHHMPSAQSPAMRQTLYWISKSRWRPSAGQFLLMSVIDCPTAYITSAKLWKCLPWKSSFIYRNSSKSQELTCEQEGECFTGRATGQHAHSCSTSGGAPTMSGKHCCHNTIYSRFSTNFWQYTAFRVQPSEKRMVENDWWRITDMFRCGEPCWCHPFSCLFGLGS